MPSTFVSRLTGRVHSLRGVAQRVARLASVEVDALVDVAQQQLAAVLVVAVLDDDERLAEVGQLRTAASPSPS